MKSYIKAFLLISLLSVVTLSCNTQNRNSTLLKDLSKKTTTAIIDVRTADEFADGHLDKSINIPLQQLADSVETLKKYENIILVCRSGNRSGKAKAMLEENYGFKNLYNGGGWKSLEEIIIEDPQK